MSPLVVLAALAIVVSPLAAGAAASAAPLSPAASSADEVTWSVQPVANTEGIRRAFEYAVDPGTQVVDSVVVVNSGNVASNFALYATDALNDPNTGAFGLLKNDTKPTDVGSWITLDQDKITLQPGQQATVPFSMLVPSDATPGDHVAGIVAAVRTTGRQNGAAVSLEQRVGARLYLRVSGATKASVAAQGAVATFNPSLNPFAAGDITLSYEVRNTGNLRVDVGQAIEISGPFGIPLGRVKPDRIANILPGQFIHVDIKAPSIVALLLTWSTITLKPSDPSAATDGTSVAGIEGAPATSPSADTVEVGDAIEYRPAATTVMGVAISWTLLILVLIGIAGIYLIWRYVSGTREQFYRAIDEATAAARDEGRMATSDDSEVAVR